MKFCRSGLIILTIGIVAGVALSFLFSRFQSQQAENPYPLLNRSALLVNDYDPLVRFQPLRQQLISAYNEHPDFHVGLYFEYLPTGANIVVNNDRAMWPASLIKIPVAMAVMKKIEKGDWSLTNELVILDEDKDDSFGDLYKEPSGSTMTIEELLRATLVDSDNTAHFVLLRNLDSSELEEVFIHLGLDEILATLKSSPEAEAVDNRMTAKTYSVFFRSLYNATYLSPANSEIFLNFLLASGQEYVRLGLPPEVKFAHKTGVRESEGVWTDSGVVYLDRRPYLMTVMLERRDPTHNPSDEEVQELFSTISKEVYDYVSAL